MTGRKESAAMGAGRRGTRKSRRRRRGRQRGRQGRGERGRRGGRVLYAWVTRATTLKHGDGVAGNNCLALPRTPPRAPRSMSSHCSHRVMTRQGRKEGASVAGAAGAVLPRLEGSRSARPPPVRGPRGAHHRSARPPTLASTSASTMFLSFGAHQFLLHV